MSNRVIAATIAYNWDWIHRQLPLLERRRYWSEAEYRRRLAMERAKLETVEGIWKNDSELTRPRLICPAAR